MMRILTGKTVRMGVQATDKVDAIKQAGELLVIGGYVPPSYINGMLTRERIQSTYLGNGIAIPHGQYEDLANVYHTGVSVVQVPEGVNWESGEKAYLVIGLAARLGEYISILANLAEVVHDQHVVEQLAKTDDPLPIINRLTWGLQESSSDEPE
jgi:mannitol/fructose-specific phosphotransferase system IIA component